MSSKAPVGDSIVSDSQLFLQNILPLLKERVPNSRQIKRSAPPTTTDDLPLTPDRVFEILSSLCPHEFVLVEESPSNVVDLQRRFKIGKPDSFYTFASGGLGWDMPAAVGLALAERQSGRNRPIIAIIGDGSFQYSVQSVYTGVQQGAHVIFVVLRNGEYGILKEFAVLEKTPNVPGLDLPGLDIVSLGNGYGANTSHAGTPEEIASAFNNALAFSGTSVIEIPITKRLNRLLG